MKTHLAYYDEATELVSDAIGRKPQLALSKLYTASQIFQRLGRWQDYYYVRRLISELHLKISNDKHHA